MNTTSTPLLEFIQYPRFANTFSLSIGEKKLYPMACPDGPTSFPIFGRGYDLPRSFSGDAGDNGDLW